MKCQLEAAEKEPHNYVWHTFWWVIRKSDRSVVGSADFKAPPDENGEVEIGYALGEEYRKNGYMAEAVAAMCSWALSRENVSAVIAETESDNFPSHRVLQSCGFEEYKISDTVWWRRGGCGQQ